MDLGSDIELIDGLPVLYIRSIGAVVVSDLHLGYEGGMVRSGIVIPKVNLNGIIETLHKAVEGRDVKKLVIVGDVKNDFSGVINEELREMRQIIEVLSKMKIGVELVKGNHDNFIESYSKELGITVYHEKLVVGRYLFAHGDKQIRVGEEDISTIIIGHEHPSIGIRSRTGTIERFRCFLSGKISYSGKKVNLIVLPAIGYFETGSDVNLHSKGRIMSPILKKANVDEMEAMAVGQGLTLNFGKVGALRRVEI